MLAGDLQSCLALSVPGRRQNISQGEQIKGKGLVSTSVFSEPSDASGLQNILGQRFLKMYINMYPFIIILN